MTETNSSICDGCDLNFRDVCLLFEDNDMEKCIVFCIAHNIIPQAIRCPYSNCGSIVSIDYSKNRFRCRGTVEKLDQVHNKTKRLRCSFSRSVFANTMFHRCKPNPSKIFQLLRAFTYGHQDFSYNCIRHNLFPISDFSIAYWRNIYHNILISYMERELQVNGKLGGPGQIIEVSEIFVGESTCFLKGDSADLIFGAFDRENKRLVLSEGPTLRETEKLLSTIKKFIHPGSIVISDTWKSYKCLSYSNFENFVGSNNYEFMNAETNEDMLEIRNILNKVVNSRTVDSKKITIKEHLAAFLFNYNIVDFGERFHRFLLESAIYYRIESEHLDCIKTLESDYDEDDTSSIVS